MTAPAPAPAEETVDVLTRGCQAAEDRARRRATAPLMRVDARRIRSVLSRLAAVERERDERVDVAKSLASRLHIAGGMLARLRTRAEAAEARLAAARAWLARVEPYPERNGDHFRELREILDAPVPPQPEPEQPTLLCGIYDAEEPMTWASNGVHYARCSICSATFEHYRAASAVELFRAHLTTGPPPPQGTETPQDSWPAVDR